MSPSAHLAPAQQLGPLLIALTICLSSTAAFANAGPIDDSDGNQVVPLNNDDVQLVRESVQVRFHGGRGWVRCRYLLRNHALRDVELSIAFVRSQDLTGNGGPFRAWVDERFAAIRWMHADLERWRPFAGGDLDSLPVWDFRVPAEDTVEVRCEYPVDFDVHAGYAGTHRSFSYRTKAAALWAGSIESAEFEIDLGDDWRFYSCTDVKSPPYMTSFIEPPGYRWVGTALRWRFETWEPSQDIRIGLYSAYGLRWEELLECRALDFVTCWTPIELTDYTGDSLIYSERSLLAAVRDAFASQGAAEPIGHNYEAFAQACLEALRLEIHARHGAPFEDERLTRFFEEQFWYAPDPKYDPARLNATEKANENLLIALRRRIEVSPELLLPLPARN